MIFTERLDMLQLLSVMFNVCEVLNVTMHSFLSVCSFLSSCATIPNMQSPSDEVYRYVELRVLSNWGHVEYTCLYRFRVHGKIASTWDSLNVAWRFIPVDNKVHLQQTLFKELKFSVVVRWVFRASVTPVGPLFLLGLLIITVTLMCTF